MGLDMYLEGRRYFSRNEYNFSDFTQPSTISEAYQDVMEAANLTGLDSDEAVGLEVRFTVGYWRKVNAVHGWFVNEIANGVDECQPIWVSRENLAKLKTLCELSLLVPSRASEVLPPAQGCFFGGTDFDDWYYMGLEKTIGIIDYALSLPEEIDFIYQASW